MDERCYSLRDALGDGPAKTRERSATSPRAVDHVVRARPAAGKAFHDVGAHIDQLDKSEARPEAFDPGAAGRDACLKWRALQ